MTEPDTRPPLKATYGNPNRRPPGRACPKCGRLKDKGAALGWYSACRDSRDLQKRWAAEDAAEAAQQAT